MRPDALNGLQVDQRDNHSIARRQQNGVRFYGGKDVFAETTGDRIVTLIDPPKFSNDSASTWRGITSPGMPLQIVYGARRPRTKR